jgi:hypothetical protein
VRPWPLLLWHCARTGGDDAAGYRAGARLAPQGFFLKFNYFLNNIPKLN